MSQEENNLLKSGPSLYKSFVIFVNRTPRPADIYWLDYAGQRVNYVPSGLSPGHRLLMDTYEGHPWIFRTRGTKNKLVTLSDAQEVFFPPSWDGESPPRYHTVNIVLPVYSLKDWCLQAVRRHLKGPLDRAIQHGGLQIPRELKRDLLHQDDQPAWQNADE